MRNTGRTIGEASLVLCSLAASWLLVHQAPELVAGMMPENIWESPMIAHISIFPWTPLHPRTHFFSGAAVLGPALAMAAGAALLVEAAKQRMAVRLAGHSRFFCAYLALFAFQALVAATAFNRSAWDWSDHLNTLIFRREPVSRTLLNLEMDWPWTSLIPLGALLVVFLGRWYWKWEYRNFLLPAIVLSVSLAVPLVAAWIREDYYAGYLWPWLLAAPAAVFLTEKVAGRWPSAAARRDVLIPLLLCLAWLLVLLTPFLRDLWIPPSPEWPNFGNVAAFPWSEQAEPRSTTVAILGALVIGLAATALVEPVKLLRAGSGFGWLVLYQLILLIDGAMTAAPDWSAYFLSQIWPACTPCDPAIFPSWPWISLLALFALLTFFAGSDGQPAGHRLAFLQRPEA